MDQTVNLLKQYFKEKNLYTYLFENKYHQKMNNDFIKDILSKYNKIFTKNITPHTIRHTRAIHLLSVGVPIIMIRDLLGHESIITTEEYAKVLEKNKFEVIENASPKNINKKLDNWNDDKNLLNQLLNL